MPSIPCSLVYYFGHRSCTMRERERGVGGRGGPDVYVKNQNFRLLARAV